MPSRRIDWRRIAAQLLSSYLLVWIPGTFAVELLGTLPSMGMRGAPAWIELIVHGAVAMFCALAGRMLRMETPAAPAAAAIGVAARTGVQLQSLLWTALPRDIAPGTQLPRALFAIGTAIVCLFLIRSISRR